MPSRLRHLVASLVLDDSVTLQIRLYRLMCATTCVLCLVFILPMNLFQNLPIWVNFGDITLGLIAGYCFWESRRGRHFFFQFFAGLILLLNPIWFLNAGSEGSLIYYFFALILYPMAIFTGRMRIALTAVVTLNACGLLVFEYFVPSWTVPFKSPADRVIDLSTGALCSCVFVAVIARLMLAAHEKEQLRLSDYGKKLASREQNYREIFNATSDALVVQDARGKVIDVNEQTCALFGYDRATLERLTVDDLSSGVSPHSRYEAAKRVKLALTEGPQTFTWRCKRASGELFWAEVTIRAGEIVREKRVIISVRDISRRVEAESALRLQEERKAAVPLEARREVEPEA